MLEEESESNPEIDYFIFVFCGTHGTRINGQHAIIINTDKDGEKMFEIED